MADPDAPAEGRGSLSVADRVVLRVAEAAACEVAGVAPRGAGTSRVGRALGRSTPSADAQVAGHRAHVHLDITAVWPSPAAALAASVRDHVTTRLHDLAGVEADAVDVTVSDVITPRALARATGADRARSRVS